jgi:putative membrane protein
MKFVTLALTLAAPLALAAGGSPDSSFYRALAEGGMTEVDLGRLAEQKTQDPKIKDFAAMMVKDHSVANEKLESLAASKQVSMPRTLGTSQLGTKSRLENLNAGGFDKSYIKSQVKAHEDTVALLQNEISSGQDPDAKGFAQSILPTVQHHLEAARSLAAEEGVKVAGR